MMSPAPAPSPEKKKPASATKFFLRGLAIALPPILTLVILLWIAGIIKDYVIDPINGTVRYTFAQFIDKSRRNDELVSMDGFPKLKYDANYRITPALKSELQDKIEKGATPSEIERTVDESQVYVAFREYAVPYEDFAEVAAAMGTDDLPKTATGLYMDLVTIRYFTSLFHLSLVAVIITVILVYFVGRIVTVRMGAWGVNKVETLILAKLPVVSNVYSSVKQVTDFLFTERKIEYNRVVAIEYPRRGIYSIGFVTGDSMLQITAAAGEPLVSVLVPTSPMPVTGYTMNVPRSELIDLDISIDQAFQYCISCGVLIPGSQKPTPELLQQELAKRLAGDGSQRKKIVPELLEADGKALSEESEEAAAPADEPS